MADVSGFEVDAVTVACAKDRDACERAVLPFVLSVAGLNDKEREQRGADNSEAVAIHNVSLTEARGHFFSPSILSAMCSSAQAQRM